MLYIRIKVSETILTIREHNATSSSRDLEEEYYSVSLNLTTECSRSHSVESFVVRCSGVCGILSEVKGER